MTTRHREPTLPPTRPLAAAGRTGRISAAMAALPLAKRTPYPWEGEPS